MNKEKLKEKELRKIVGGFGQEEYAYIIRCSKCREWTPGSKIYFNKAEAENDLPIMEVEYENCPACHQKANWQIEEVKLT